MSDTVFAPATAPGRAAIAVVRLSGPGSRAALTALAGALPSPRRASLRPLTDPATGARLDEAVVIWLPGPASYTGEDGAELHLHGGSAVVESVTDCLAGLGLRLADPGEFTRRAFENGKLDLAQAEAVADLVEAETLGQRDQALAQLDGALSERYADWRAGMLVALALLEAAVDFPDEDLPEALAEAVRPRLDALIVDLDAALGDAVRGERVREGFRVALVGAPNAGKSSLLNRLAGREAAIVTATPGTTRDIIETPMVLSGFKILLADMAGLRETQEDIEAEGVRRARAWAEAADLRLWVVDTSASTGDWREAYDLVHPSDLCVLNKSDAEPGLDLGAAHDRAVVRGIVVVEASALSDEGIAGLHGTIERLITERLGGREFPAATRLRHRARLQEALEHLRRADAALTTGAELAAEDLRLAARALGRVSGRIDPEAVLDVVFSSFCIGK